MLSVCTLQTNLYNCWDLYRYFLFEKKKHWTVITNLLNVSHVLAKHLFSPHQSLLVHGQNWATRPSVRVTPNILLWPLRCPCLMGLMTVCEIADDVIAATSKISQMPSMSWVFQHMASFLCKLSQQTHTHTFKHTRAHTDTLPSSRPPMVKASAADRMLLHVQRKTHAQLLDAHHCFSHRNYSQCCSHSRPPLKNTSWTTFLGTSLLIFMNLKALNAFVTTSAAFFSSKFCSTLTTWNSPSSPISRVSSRLFFPTISYELPVLLWPESSRGAIKSYGKFLLRSECEEAEGCFLQTSRQPKVLLQPEEAPPTGH